MLPRGWRSWNGTFRSNNGAEHLSLLLVLAGLLAGTMNAVAGGGSFVSFPVMVLVGLPPIAANATSTVALFPGTHRQHLGVSGRSAWRRRDRP